MRNNIFDKGWGLRGRAARSTVGTSYRSSFPSKGQMSESVSFVLLVTAIIFITVIMRLFILSESVQSLRITADRSENERLKSGTNALFLMRDKTYEMSLLDLAGRAASERTEVVYVGLTLDPVNVSYELEWRMDALFGKGNWHLTIPFPGKKQFVTQMVLVADVSGSLCDDLNDLKKLPPIIEDINKKGREVFATLYLLGKSECSRMQPPYPEIVCSDFETEHFKCRPLIWFGSPPGRLSQPTKPEDVRVCKSLGMGGKFQTNEDWGNGIACASDWGPVGGWEAPAESIRLGIVISDELSGGSECGKFDACASCGVGSNTAQAKSLENGVAGALKNDVKVFGLLANPCGPLTAPGSGAEFICDCKDVLANYMNYISSKTGGRTFALADASEVSKVIEEIIIKSKKEVTAKIDIGNAIPSRARVHAYEILVPTTGNYTKATAYIW